MSEQLAGKSDEELWQAFVTGGRPADRAVPAERSDVALTVLIGRYWRSLYWYLLLSTGRQDLAAQYSRDTWGLLAACRRPYSGFSSFKSWLYAVATQNYVPATHPAPFGLAELIDELKRTAQTSRRSQLFFLITEMKPAERQPFLLVTVAGLPVADAARACRFTVERTWKCLATAYARLARTELFRRSGAADEL